MFQSKQFHKDESGQTALETAIILIAFVVVASVFAFTVLSAGQVSTEKGESAIYAGLEQVESSTAVKGALIAEATTVGTTGTVDSVRFTVALASGGDPVDLNDAAAAQAVRIGYRDNTQYEPEIPWTVDFIGAEVTTDKVLEDGELAEITVDLTDLTDALPASTEFTIEVKPPSGAVLNVTRTTPAAILTVMELR